jgi:hypothetical protein
MSDVPVSVVMYSLPVQELTIRLRGDTTLGDLRTIIHSTIGGRPPDRAWVSFADESRGVIPFSHTETESDGLEIRFLRCSPYSAVSVGVFRYAESPKEEVAQPAPPNAGHSAKRAAADGGDPFSRAGVPRV